MNINIGNGYALRDWPTAWNDGDQDRWVSLADDYDIWANLDDSFPHPYTLPDAEEWVTLQYAKDPAEHFAICDATGPVGGIGVNTERGDAPGSGELGYLVGKPYWGRGIATAAAKAVTTYGFDTLGLDRIFAKVKVSNAASARVLEKVGFRHESSDSLEVPADYLLYTVEREDWPSTRTTL